MEDRRPAPHASCTFGTLAHAPRTGSLCARLVFLINFSMSKVQANFYLCCVTNNFKSVFVSKSGNNSTVYASHLWSGILLHALVFRDFVRIMPIFFWKKVMYGKPVRSNSRSEHDLVYIIVKVPSHHNIISFGCHTP
jgi:hypothetical protein